MTIMGSEITWLKTDLFKFISPKILILIYNYDSWKNYNDILSKDEIIKIRSVLFFTYIATI